MFDRDGWCRRECQSCIGYCESRPDPTTFFWLTEYTQYSPVSGVVVEVNRALADQPGKLNKSAEQDGNIVLLFG